MAGTGDLVLRTYGNFRGVDFRGEEINLIRSPDSLNVWKDYKYTDSIRTRPGMELKNSFGGRINSICEYATDLYVHSGRKLYRGNEEIYSGLDDDTDNLFVFNDVLYIKGEGYYLQYNHRYPEDGVTKVVGYIPTTSIGRKPSGGGTIFEPVNLLSRERYNTFLADGESIVYRLDCPEIEEVKEVIVDGEIYVHRADYDYDWGHGEIHFRKVPPAPKTDGQDNVRVRFSTLSGSDGSEILFCRGIQVFDNRIFFYGNMTYPNKIWHCRLNDPTYCSDLDYYEEGHDSSLVKGMVAGDDRLWVFKEPANGNTTAYYHKPVIDSEYGKIYPSQHSSISTGCVGKAINFNDDIVFFGLKGMEGVSGDITTEQFLSHRSSLVDRKLTEGVDGLGGEYEDDYTNMVLAEWRGYLMVFIGNRVYLADSRAMFTNENHVEYEWFYWELEKRVTAATVIYGDLYLGTDDGGIYTLTDMKKESGIESYWTTPKDKFKAPHKLKTTNKRGCVVEATGDISVYAKIEDTDFEHIGTYKDIEDYFVSRIKRKKFKDIQLKFHSNTRFSLETATLECFIGGYIKR